LLKTKGFKNIELKKDIYGVDRMVKCLKFWILNNDCWMLDFIRQLGNK
jgi:hypothetical protein